jgi:uncharacterized protein YrrD
MLRSARSMLGDSIEATDGDIGSVHDFYYDDQTWALRYLVVDTGGWLPGRRVLLSPQALYESDSVRRADGQRHTFPVRLTRQQVKDSPEIDTDKPLSRQQEENLFEHYRWVPYWGLYSGAYPSPASAVAVPMPEVGQRPSEQEEEDADPHLRSVREVQGYHILAVDGDIGHVDDFIIEDGIWHVRYLVVDTRNWLPGKKVLVATEWVEDANFVDRVVAIDLQRKAIEACPVYDPSEPVNREYEQQLYDYYGRPVYWHEAGARR